MAWTAAGTVAAPAAEGDRQTLEALTRKYYQAVVAEDTEALLPLLELRDADDAAEKVLTYRAVFQATDAEIDSVKIEDVQFDADGASAGVYLTLTGRVYNHDRSEQRPADGRYVMLASRTEHGWRVAKVMRAGLVSVRGKMLALRRAARGATEPKSRPPAEWIARAGTSGESGDGGAAVPPAPAPKPEPSSPDPGRPKGRRVYRDESLGFQLPVPADWNRRSDIRDESLAAAFSPAGAELPLLMVWRREAPALSAKDMRDWIAEQGRSDAHKVVASDTVGVPHGQGGYVDFDQEMNGVPVRGRILMVSRPGVLFSVQGYVLRSRLAADWPVMRKVIEGFELARSDAGEPAADRPKPTPTPPAKTDPPAATWRHDPKWGFWIAQPAGWVAEKSSPDSGLIQSYQSPDDNGGVLVFAFAAKVGADERFNVSAFADQLEKAFGEQLPFMTARQSSKEGSAEGARLVVRTYRGKAEGEDVIATVLYAWREQKAYVAMGIHSVKADAAVVKATYQALRSLRFSRPE